MLQIYSTACLSVTDSKLLGVFRRCGQKNFKLKPAPSCIRKPSNHTSESLTSLALGHLRIAHLEACTGQVSWSEV